jgi:CHAT domain-containing protein
MNRKLLITFLCCVVLYLAHRAYEPTGQPDYLATYRQAMLAYESEDSDDSTTLSLFQKTISQIKQSPAGNDSLLLECYHKAGIISISSDRPEQAISFFKRAVAKSEALHRPAAQRFESLLYTGRAYYALSRYDSALYYYKTSENIANASPATLANTERLYNMMGATWYDLGNFSLAKTYFEKALAILSPKNDDYKDLFIRYKNNIAACLLRVDAFDEANAICDELLRTLAPGNPLRNIVLQRKANIQLQLGDAAGALSYFNRVVFTDRSRLNLLNEKASAFVALHQPDSALYYLDQSASLNQQYFPQGKNQSLANTFKLKGDVLGQLQRPAEALAAYQQGIIMLCNGFTDTSVAQNPQQFQNIYAANTLLEMLIAKAALQEQAAPQAANALNTYRSIFELTRYMEGHYDSEESRLFLNKKKYALHDAPIQMALRLFAQTGDQQFLEEAYYFDQQNKSSVLRLNLGELAAKQSAGIDPALLIEEKNIRQHMTAVSLKAMQPASDSALAGLRAQLRDDEIALNRVLENMRNNTRFAGLEQQQEHVTASALQKQIPADATLLSYHLSKEKLVCFWLQRNDWNFFTIPITDTFFNSLRQLSALCRNPASGNEYRPLARQLYRQLMQPVEKISSQQKRLIIIPDDELHLLPFETLLNNNDEPLVLTHDITYCYAGSLAFREGGNGINTHNLLAVAPFAGSGFGRFAPLQSSAIETNSLPGTKLRDAAATKASFLKQASQFEVLHLATHANANDANPQQSYIGFRQDAADSSSQYLYSPEIYNLDLTHTRLVYLSACETGQGQLVNGEGAMSLSRAFAYAGCANIVTSLWQADDASTATITQSFYRHIEAGKSEGEALQLAKKEYLSNPQIAQRKKTPFYWAHLVFNGQVNSKKAAYPFLWLTILLGAIVSITGAVLLRKKFGRRDSVS